MTNFVETDQRRSTCPESAGLLEAVCVKDSECQNRPFSPRINGLWTGKCIRTPQVNVWNGTMNITKHRPGLCEYTGTSIVFENIFYLNVILGWCPAEDESHSMMIEEVLNYTLFIKNFIEFPMFNVKHKNMVDELKPCIFDPQNNKDCPIFGLEYIINQAEKDPVERNLMLRYGAVIRVKLEWDCDLDRSIKACKPVYSFARLDVPFRDKPFSVGFNFRYGSHWKYHDVHHRTLTKAYGLRLIISVSGKAGKFDFITLTLNTGSLVGLFGLATFVCDIILLHISKQARTYRNHIFETVHLRTRMNSVFRRPKEMIIRRYSNSVSNDNVGGTRRSPGKTVVIRPLTLMNVENTNETESV